MLSSQLYLRRSITLSRLKSIRWLRKTQIYTIYQKKNILALLEVIASTPKKFNCTCRFWTTTRSLDSAANKSLLCKKSSKKSWKDSLSKPTLILLAGHHRWSSCSASILHVLISRLQTTRWKNLTTADTLHLISTGMTRFKKFFKYLSTKLCTWSNRVMKNPDF